MSATELFNANQATTTVTSGGTDAPASGTSEMWTVASSAMFGAAATGVSQFHVADPAAPSEVIAVTNVSGTTWTVTRGAESTPPVSHVAGFTVYQVVTTGFLRRVVGLAPSGDTSGATDVANINAAVTAAATAGGGTVKGVPGTPFYLNAAFVLKSGVTLDMTGCTVIEVAGSNCNMITNAAVTAAATGTGSMTSGSNTLTTSLASQAVAGQSVYVAGGSNGGSNVLCGIVGTIGSGTLTVVDYSGNALNAAANVTSGAVSLYNRDSNIEITGGKWERGANGFTGSSGPASSPLCCTTNLKRIDGLNVHDLTVSCTARGYNILFGDCTNFSFENITISTPTNVVNTDGINGQGPLFGGTIQNIFGANGDDFVALDCIDDGITEDTTGNITDVTVSDLYPNGNAGAGVTLYNPGAYYLQRVTCENIRGFTGTEAVRIWSDSATCWVDSILIRGVSTNNAGGVVQVFATNAYGQVTIEDVAWEPASGNTGNAAITLASGSDLGGLSVDGLTLAAAGCYGVVIDGTLGIAEIRNIRQPDGAIAATPAVYAESGASIGILSIEGLRLFAGTTSNSVIYLAGPVTGALHLRDCYINGSGATLLGTASGLAAMQVLMSDITLDGATALAAPDSAIDFIIDGLNVKSTVLDTFLIYCSGTAATVSVRGRGLINPHSVPTFALVNSAPAPRLAHPEALADVSTLSRSYAGDTCINTNSGLSCGTGWCISSGSGTVGSWKNLYSGLLY